MQLALVVALSVLGAHHAASTSGTICGLGNPNTKRCCDLDGLMGCCCEGTTPCRDIDAIMIMEFRTRWISSQSGRVDAALESARLHGAV